MNLHDSLARAVDGAREALHLGEPAPDALAIIKDDHERVEALFRAIRDGEGTTTARTRATVEQIVRELEAHAKMEETIFYPALRARTKATGDDRQNVLEAIEEHGTMKDLIKKIKKSTGRDETLRAKIQVLHELVSHHVREEEDKMFGEARRLLGEKRLTELGIAMAKFKTKMAPKPTARATRTNSIARTSAARTNRRRSTDR